MTYTDLKVNVNAADIHGEILLTLKAQDIDSRCDLNDIAADITETLIRNYDLTGPAPEMNLDEIDHNDFWDIIGDTITAHEEKADTKADEVDLED